MFGIPGAHGDNSGRDLRAAQGANTATLQSAAGAYSNYRVANAMARQQALNNMMSLYQGPQNTLGAISGGQGANASLAGYSPFSAVPGYFNVGRAAPVTQNYNGRPSAAFGIGIDTSGHGLGGPGSFNPGIGGGFAPAGPNSAIGQSGSGYNVSSSANLAQNLPGSMPINNGGIGYGPGQTNPFQFRRA